MRPLALRSWEKGALVERRAAVTAAIVSAACFGTLAIFGNLMYESGAQPLQVLVWRFTSAALLLGAYVSMRRPGSLSVDRRTLFGFVRLSMLGYGAASLCFFFALRHADASVVAILLYTYPALVVVFEAARDRVLPGPARLVAVALTFAGCIFVVDPFAGRLSVEPLGIVLGLGSGLGYASFSLMSHRLMRTHPRGVIMTYLFGFTAVLAALAALVTGSSLSTSSWDGRAWMLLAGLVLVPTFAAVILYLRAVQSLGASQAALLSTFEPVFTLVLAVVVLHESLSAWQWIGASLVVLGVILAEKTGVATEEPAAP